MAKRRLEPNTVLYPVPLVFLTSGMEAPNIMTVNRIASVAAEPPMLAVALRPGRLTSELLFRYRQFVVNLPTADMVDKLHLVGTTSGREVDKAAQAGLTLVPASVVAVPLIAECPVNIECVVRHIINLRSHDLFLGEVLAVQAEEALLDEMGEIRYERANPLVYPAAVVRERPAL